MKLTLLITAALLTLVLARITWRCYRGEITGNPFAAVLMIVLTCGIIGGLVAATTI